MAQWGSSSQDWVIIILSTFYEEVIIICICYLIQSEIKELKIRPHATATSWASIPKKTPQKGNGVLVVLKLVLDYEMLTMYSTVIADPVIVSPVINPPSVVLFTLKMDVPPPLTSPIHLEPLPLIAPPLSPSKSVADK